MRLKSTRNFFIKSFRKGKHFKIQYYTQTIKNNIKNYTITFKKRHKNWKSNNMKWLIKIE